MYTGVDQEESGLDKASFRRQITRGNGKINT